MNHQISADSSSWQGYADKLQCDSVSVTLVNYKPNRNRYKSFLCICHRKVTS